MKSLVIVGRSWFNKAKGHTYFSAVAIIDGVEVARVPYCDGYGSDFEYAAFLELMKRGLLTEVVMAGRSGGNESPYSYCQRNNIGYTAHLTKVTRRKDL